ncbi:putative lipoxygenase 6 [Hordeum vulgare]|nr:putative lipoxygenase 6 [Hordeum vulgare]
MFRNHQRLMLGGIVLAIRHHREFFRDGIVIEGSRLPCGIVHFACNSWLQTTEELPDNSKWVFFSQQEIPNGTTWINIS